MEIVETNLLRELAQVGLAHFRQLLVAVQGLA